MRRARAGGAGADGNSSQRNKNRVLAPLPTCPVACRSYHQLHITGAQITGTVCERCGLEVSSHYWADHLQEIAEAMQ